MKLLLASTIFSFSAVVSMVELLGLHLLGEASGFEVLASGFGAVFLGLEVVRRLRNARRAQTA